MDVDPSLLSVPVPEGLGHPFNPLAEPSTYLVVGEGVSGQGEWGRRVISVCGRTEKQTTQKPVKGRAPECACAVIAGEAVPEGTSDLGWWVILCVNTATSPLAGAKKKEAVEAHEDCSPGCPFHGHPPCCLPP